jgi:hypothetical protein
VTREEQAADHEGPVLPCTISSATLCLILIIGRRLEALAVTLIMRLEEKYVKGPPRSSCSTMTGGETCVDNSLSIAVHD